MFEDEFEQFRAMARRGSLPLPESPIIMIEHSPRRTKSLKGNRKKKEFVMSPLVREENATDKDADSSDSNSLCDTQQLLKVPEPEPPMVTVPKSPGSHARSSSCKKAKNPRNLQLQIESRPRSSSLPNVQEPIFLSPFAAQSVGQNDTYRVRCFCTTSKGIVNKGDSIVRAKSNSSMVSAASYGSGLNLLIDDRRLSLNSQGSATHSAASSNDASSGETPVFKVIVMGKDGVGKTAVTQQFMTSEYMGAQNTSFDDEEEKTVSVLLDGEESIMDVIDAPDGEGYEGYEDADAYVVVFSITDISSFQFATDLIRKVREVGTKHVAVILVANKSDLVRGRSVSEEAGKTIATLYEAKYIEISVVLNHNVDELLVGILSQIRLNMKRSEKLKRRDKKSKDSNCVNKAAKGLINRLIKKPAFSKSCDNLLVL